MICYTVVRHGERKICCGEKTLGRLVAGNRVLHDMLTIDLRPQTNIDKIPNGSMDDIAAISNDDGTWNGEMPHPEATKMPWTKPVSQEKKTKSKEERERKYPEKKKTRYS